MREDGDLFGFERLDVWREAVDLSCAIYELTKAFPREEMFGISAQIRRAGVSVAANIAEGTSRSSSRDQARFFEIAYGSLNETMTLLHIALRQQFLCSETFIELRRQIAGIRRMLSGLKRSTLHGSNPSLNPKHRLNELWNRR
ncbi:MAG: hypothetical protein A2Z18_06700 [Armatimonadetes bacterium RBG_16_58_9]|nr:MAG: hypothetical protein A2Z18_06700 [Armatimonadetes bacterium RBG_16_58_9]